MCAEGDFRVQQCWCRDGFDQPASVVVGPAGSHVPLHGERSRRRGRRTRSKLVNARAGSHGRFG